MHNILPFVQLCLHADDGVNSLIKNIFSGKEHYVKALIEITEALFNPLKHIFFPEISYMVHD